MHTDVVPGPWVQPHLVGFDLRRRPHLEADVLVIGGGVAGLSAALAAADAGAEVLLLVKSDLWHSNTVHAQGGVAAVLGNEEREALDDVELHVSDTLQAGVGLCDETVHPRHSVRENRTGNWEEGGITWIHLKKF